MNSETLNLSANALVEYNRKETAKDLKNEEFKRYCLNELTHKDHIRYIYSVLPN